VTASSTKKSLLIIDDDELFCDAIRIGLHSQNLTIHIAHKGQDGLAFCKKHHVDIILLDQKLPDGEGRNLCPQLLQVNDQVKIIFITAYPSFESAVKGIQVGAHDYLSKPFELDELRLSIEQMFHTQELEKNVALQHYKRHREHSDTVLVSHGGLQDTQDIVQRAAQSQAPVIITGETGTGKNVVAKYIHFHSQRADNGFLSINCAALPENLIEAELFGTVKGAFTGATETRKGIFEMADGGTLLLDEIGEMPLHLQSKLLSVLEEGQVRKLGSHSLKPVDVRIIAATNRDIEQAVKDNRFREDLYFRLNVLRIHVPPLRQRQQDIPDLCRHFLNKIPDAAHMILASEELDLLCQYHWPGNVRELKNIIERAVIFQRDGGIYPSELLQSSSATSAKSSHDGHQTLEMVIRHHILTVLESQQGNLTQTSNTLGISLSTLKRRLKEYATRSN
jgi:DNA-binding NtrC family response regulator